jgi:hypothetical protein
MPEDPSDLLTEGVQRAVAFLAPHAGAFVADSLATLGSLVVMLFALFFILRDGDTMSRRLRDLLPFTEHESEQLLSDTRDLVIASVGAGVVVAVAQGIVGGLAFLWARARRRFWAVGDLPAAPSSARRSCGRLPGLAAASGDPARRDSLCWSASRHRTIDNVRPLVLTAGRRSTACRFLPARRSGGIRLRRGGGRADHSGHDGAFTQQPPPSRVARGARVSSG